VTIRGATYDGSSMLTSGPEIGTSGDIQIASVSAPGAIVYWTTSNGTGFRGFHIGDESVVTVASPSDDGSATLCIGCHSSTPDGTYVAYSATDNAGDGDPAFMSFMSSDGMHQKPSYISATAEALLTGSDRIGQELPQFSSMHWQTGDRIPEDLFQKMKRAKTFRAANAQMRQLGLPAHDAAAEDPQDGIATVGVTFGQHNA